MPRKQTQQDPKQPLKADSDTPEVNPQETQQTAEVKPDVAPEVVASKPASRKPLFVQELPNGVTIETF